MTNPDCLTPIIDPQLIPEQAGFQPGKSCTNQIMNLTQHIEDGSRGCITSAFFVDLTADFDTMNHQRFLNEIYKLTRGHNLIAATQRLLQNSQFFISCVESAVDG